MHHHIVTYYNSNSGSVYQTQGQAFYINAGGSALDDNYINDSSISNAYNNNGNSYYALYITSGNIAIAKNNVSNNYCSYYSALCSNPSDDSILTTYSSFVNNTSQ